MPRRHGSVVAFLALIVLTPWLRSGEKSPQSERPKLAVLVVFDQFRGDYLGRWDELFGEDGFHRLMKEGAWYQECRYPYAVTATGPGHASLATGAYPSRHGITHNDWFDRETREAVYCVGSERYGRVPELQLTSGEKPDPKKPKGFAPDRLLLPTIADALKDATAGKARVVSLACKDRAAVLSGGKKPDGCYWLDEDLFVTSTYYRDKVHPWVEEFNRERLIDHWFDKDWVRLRPDLDYEKYSGPDDMPGEGRGKDYGRTFPHPLNGGLTKPGKNYYQAIYASPRGNELLIELAKHAIDAEKLGTHDTPDLLCISFSSNDPVGHIWGPDSQEVLDVTLRSDLIMKELLKYLDDKVGKGKYVLAMSADHGVCPLPEVSRTKGKDACRISIPVLRKQAEEFLDETFGARKPEKGSAKPDKESGAHSVWFEGGLMVDDLFYPWVYLNRPSIKERGLKQEDVEEKLAAWLKKQPAISAVYSRSQLIAGIKSADEIGQRVLHSFQPDRCGDLAIITTPYCLIYQQITGSGHGSPHPYDTHVPLLLYGPGVQAGIHKKPIVPQATAVLLARLLGIKPPEAAEATLLDEYLDEVVPRK